MANQKRIPFIPQQTPDFKPMRYYYCENDISAKAVTRSTFLNLLEQQPYPIAQVNIDLDGGYVYLFPYCPERAECFIQLNREVAAAYKRYYREQQALRTGKRQTDLHLDQPLSDDGLTFGDTLADTDTPETLLMSRERFIGHRAAFDALTDADRDVLLGYLRAGCNARELARRLGKDPSYMLKRVKDAARRLQKNIEKISDPMSTFHHRLSEQASVRTQQRRNGGGNHGQAQSYSRTPQSTRERR